MSFIRKIKLANGDVVMDRRFKSIPFYVLKWVVGVIVFVATTYAGYINFASKVPILEIMCHDNKERIIVLETKMDYLVEGMKTLLRKSHGERR